MWYIPIPFGCYLACEPPLHHWIIIYWKSQDILLWTTILLPFITPLTAIVPCGFPVWQTHLRCLVAAEPRLRGPGGSSDCFPWRYPPTHKEFSTRPCIKRRLNSHEFTMLLWWSMSTSVGKGSSPKVWRTGEVHSKSVLRRQAIYREAIPRTTARRAFDRQHSPGPPQFPWPRRRATLPSPLRPTQV